MTQLSANDAIDLVRRFRQMRLLVIGDAMLDTYHSGSATRLCSEGPVPVVQKIDEQRLPGGAANTAANVRALDAEVFLVGVIGQDLAGTCLRKTLQDCQLTDHWLIEDHQASTLHKLRIQANGQYIVRFDEGGSKIEQASPYQAVTQQRLQELLAELYPQSDAIIISDYCYGVLSQSLIECLQILQRQQPRPILIDSKALQHYQTLPATVLTPNYSEARQLLERIQGQRPVQSDNPADLTGVSQIAEQLLTYFNAEHIAITLAEHGVYIINRKRESFHLSAYPVKQANDVGAGDTFIAAFALALAAGSDIATAAQIAIDAAGIAVSKQQTAMVQYQELLQRVSMRVYSTQAYQLREQRGDAIERLKMQLEVERLAGHRIVFTNGVFDILHAGHVELLRQARAQGDILVVALNSDRSARRLKGPGRPINNERDRMALVAALDMVDYVVLFDEDTPSQMITTLRPHIHVKGGDYAEEALPEAQAVQDVGGQIVILPLVGTVSTSSVIDRILLLNTRFQNIGNISNKEEIDIL